MTALTGVDQGAWAIGQWAVEAAGDPAPEQKWGSAASKGHRASGGATDAATSGGRDGALTAPGELPPEGVSVPVRLEGDTKLPKPGPATEVKPPQPDTLSGFDPKTSKELEGRRQERAQTFRNEDGTFTTRFYAEPVHHRDRSGTWRKIDTRLVSVDGTGPRTMSANESGWETSSTEIPIGFGASADIDPLVQMRLTDELSVGYSLTGARSVAGRVEGNVITYPEVRESADLEFLAGSDSIKETLVLKDRNAPTEWRFPLSLDGLTASIDDHGGVVFTDLGGVPQAWMPSGWMEDSRVAENANQGEISTGVTYQLVEEMGRQVLVVTLDRAWLSAPERMFPVRVDPSLKSVDATAGTYVQAPYNQNFSSDTVLKVGTYDGGSHKAAAFLRFLGLETSLKNAWVVGADLALYNTWSYSCTARPVTVHPITSSWSESTTSTYPGPSTGSSLVSRSFAHGWKPAGSDTWSCGPAWETLKLGEAGRKLVDDWTHGRQKNYGLAVKASTTDSYGWKQFGSDDYPNGKPSLDVTWTKYGAAYQLGEFTAPVTATTQGAMKVTITNQGQETWPAGGSYKLRYNLYDASGAEITDSSKIVYTEMPTAVSPGESVTVDAKIAPLAPATYTLVWTMTDYGATRFTSAGVPGVGVKFSAVNIPPRLVAEAPASGIVSDSLRPTLWADGTDQDRYPSALQYQFEVCDVEGRDVRKNCRLNTRSANKRWSVPSGWLSWGKTYAWYAYVFDGAATSTRPAPALFTTEVPQPGITSHLGGADAGREFGARTGHYVTAATDAAVSTVGPELAVTRTYNSLDPRLGGLFGAGWSTRWDMRLREEPDLGTVLVTLADGSQARFGTGTANEYVAPKGSTVTLTRAIDGGWVIRERSGATYHFGPNGLLYKVVDSAGRGQRLSYEAEDGGPLRKVTDLLSGRSLDFTWTGSHVAAVTTSPVDASTPGLTWTYSYEGDRLAQVCPPTSATKCTRYSYEDGSLYRTAVRNSNPISYWRLGETEGSIARSEVPSRTGFNDALYRDVTLGVTPAVTGTSNGAAGFDGAASVIELPENALKTSEYMSMELWFRTTAPGVLATLQGAEVGQRPTRYSPFLNVDGAGKLRGQFYTVEYAGTKPIVSTKTVTDGAWHHAVLTTSGTTQTLYLDGAAVGSLTGTVTTRDDQYAYLGAGWGNEGWMGVTSGTYHLQGAMDDVAVYTHVLDAKTVAEHYAARNTAGRMTKVVLPSGRTHATVVYDNDTGRVTSNTDENGGVWRVSDEQYSAGSASYASEVASSGPVGYWRLGERYGASARSETGDAANGSYQNSVDLGQPGVFADGDNTSSGFGGNAYAQIPEELLHQSTNVAVELWFRTSEPGVLVGDQGAELDGATTPTGGWTPVLYVGADNKLHGKFYAASAVTATPLASTTTVADNEWHHAVISASGSTQTLYLDGEKQGTLAGAVNHQANKYTYIGAGFAGGSWPSSPGAISYFPGQIDEVAIYAKPLDGASVQRHFRSRNAMVAGDGARYLGSVTGTGPSAYWRLDETSGTTAVSKAAAGVANGTYTNTTLGIGGAFGTGDNAAVRFAGNGNIRIPSGIVAGDSSLAVEMWFRTATSGVLLGFQDAALGSIPTSWRPALNIDGSGKLRGEFYLSGASGATPITSTQTVTDNEWHHVVLTGADNAQQLYLDGVLVGTLNGTISDQSRTYTYLGAGYASSGWMGVASGTYYFTGDMDEVALYDHPLTAEQVVDHFESRQYSGVSALASTVTVTNPVGKSTSTTYDVLRSGRRLADTDEDGGITTYTYDTGGFPHTVTDPNGHATITGHDARGNTVSVTTCRDSNSCWTSFTDYYLNADDPLDLRNDKPIAIRDARSTGPGDNRYRTMLTYSTLGLPTATRLVDGRESTTIYTDGTEPAQGGGTTPAGLVKTESTTGGAVTAYHYFANGDLARTTAPSGLTTEYSYDGLGRKISEKQISDTYPDGMSTAFAYDKLSRPVTETGGGVKNDITGVTHTAKVTRSYDEDGNLLSESTEDTTGGDATRTTTHRYNERGLNDSSTDAEGNTTLLAYDALGRVTAMTDAAGTRFTYAYTPRGEHAETVLKDWTGSPTSEIRDLVVLSNAYDPAGRLASTSDAMGATTTYTYFDDGLPATATAKQITQADGTRRDIVLEANSYDGAGNLTKQVTGGGRTTVTHTLDATSRITKTVLDPNDLNRVTTFAYDGDDRIIQETATIDSSGKKLTTTTDYDKAGNPTKDTLTDGTSTHITTRSYDQRGLLVREVSPRGNLSGASSQAHATDYQYDALGRLTLVTDPPVQVEEQDAQPVSSRPQTRVGYNTFGETTDSRDARGAETRTIVDRLGRVTALTLPTYTPPGDTPITAVMRTTYDALGRATAETDALNRTTRYVYDQFGNLTKQTDPAVQTELTSLTEHSGTFNSQQTSLDGGSVSTFTWTPTGEQLSATDPTGARTEATYDELGRQLTATTVERYPSLQNLTSRYTWDDTGNQTASTTPAGGTTRTAYNAAGEPVTVTDPVGGITKFGYDGLGRQTETIDATNRKTTTTYDALDNATAIADFGTGTTALRTVRAEFDVEGNQTAQISAEQSRSTSTHDALGRVTQLVETVSADKSITTSFGYDAAGNRTRLTNGRGHTTRYTFTPWNLPESTIEPATTAHPNATDRTWTTVYDAAGQAITELLPGGVKRERSYDALGRLAKETGTGSEVTTSTRTFRYDLADRMTSVGTDNPLAGNSYTYNDRGQLLGAEGPGGTTTYAYDLDGNMTERTDPANTTEYGYDAAGRLQWLWNEMTSADIWYNYDTAGRLKLEQYANLPQGSSTWTESARRTYDYDSLGRLVDDKITNPAGTVTAASITYGYDLDDRLTSKKTTGTAGAGDNAYGYDQAGRLASWTSGSTTTAYEWDDAGNRTKAGTAAATYDERNRLLTGGGATHTYTPRGTLATVTGGTGGTRQLAFDAFERKITDGTSTFTYDSLDRVTTYNGTAFTYDGGSNNLITDGTTSYARTPDGSLLSSKRNGSAQWSVTDQHTDRVAGLSADGLTVTDSTTYDPFGKVTATQGNAPAIGYQSGWTDPSSEDVNMAARWYEPGTGAFASRDTWLLPPVSSAQANRFVYANADPLNATDPTGHMRAYGTGGNGRGYRGGGSYSGITPPIRYTEVSKTTKPRRAAVSYSSTSRVSARSQNRKNTREMDRYDRSRTPSYTRASGNRGNTGRCTYSCGRGGSTSTYRGSGRGGNTTYSRGTGRGTNTTYSRGTGNSRGTSGSRGTVKAPNTTRPTAPRPPQNPNRGPRPKPAPTRPAPKPTVDVARIRQHSIDAAIRYDRMLPVEVAAVYQPAPLDTTGLEDLQDMFPGVQIDTDQGFGGSGADHSSQRTSNSCSRDFPSSDPSFYYAPMTRFGSGVNDCRATGAVARIDAFDLRPWRLDPKWKPAGYERLPASNRAALHVIGNQMGGARDTLRNFVAGYQTPANSPHMRSLEDDVTKAVKSGERVTLGVLPIYGGPDLAIPTEIEMYAVGDNGYRLNCTVYNRPTGGYLCSARSSGGSLSAP
ncbi:LamG-like jellyroll fold domain-containing protein [Streptomyces sannanensis]